MLALLGPNDKQFVMNRAYTSSTRRGYLNEVIYLEVPKVYKLLDTCTSTFVWGFQNGDYFCFFILTGSSKEFITSFFLQVEGSINLYVKVRIVGGWFC